jgi:hypothetical protein
MFTLRYFFGYELPKTLGLGKRLMDDDRLIGSRNSECGLRPGGAIGAYAPEGFRKKSRIGHHADK